MIAKNLLILVNMYFFLNIIYITFIECPIHRFLHIYCPGCGCTRSLEALLKMDILSSLYYNPMVIITFIVAILFGATYLLEAKKIKHVDSDSFVVARKRLLYSTLIIWAGYFIARNVALLAFGFDWIGDFL